MFLDNLKTLTFTFFKFKDPNFKQFLWNIGTGNMSESYLDAKAILDNVKSSAWGFGCQLFEIIGEYSAAACTRLYSLGSLFSAGYHHSYICLYYVYLWGAKKLFIFLTNNTVSDLKYI